MPKRFLLIRPPVEEVVPTIPEVTLPDSKNESIFKWVVLQNLVDASLPYGLLKIGAWLKDQGHQVKMLDFGPHSADPTHERLHLMEYRTPGLDGKSPKKYPVYLIGNSFEECKELLSQQEEPDEIYITTSMTFHAKSVAIMILICKEAFPRSKVTVGGILASLCPEFVKESGADEVHIGIVPDAEPYPSDISIMDYVPDYHLFKSTRGCPYSCSYCSVHIIEGRNMVFRDWKLTFNEIKHAYDTYGITNFRAWESNLLVNASNHFEKVLDAIIESGMKVTLEAPEGVAPQLLTPSIARKMKLAGFSHIEVPLESASEEINIKRYNRVVTTGVFEKSIQTLLDAGFLNRELFIFCLTGLPDQSLDLLISGMWKCWQLKVRPFFTFYTPIPRTREYENYKGMITHKTLGELHPYLWPFAGPTFSVEDMEDFLRVHFSIHPLARFDSLPLDSEVRKKLLHLLKEDFEVREYSYQIKLNHLLTTEDADELAREHGQTGNDGLRKLIIHPLMRDFERYQEDYAPIEQITTENKANAAMVRSAEELEKRGIEFTDRLPETGGYASITDYWGLLIRTRSECRAYLTRMGELFDREGTAVVRVWDGRALKTHISFFPWHATDENSDVPVVMSVDEWTAMLRETGFETKQSIADLPYLDIEIIANRIDY